MHGWGFGYASFVGGTLYRCRTKENYLSVRVDDMLLIGSKEDVSEFCSLLQSEFHPQS